MASAFGHALTAIAIGSGFSKTIHNWKFVFIGIVCSILPDADVISFKLGIAYEAFWGHRGFTHSLLFSFALAVIVMTLFYREEKMFEKRWSLFLLYFFLATISHAVLDAMTNGGHGVAFFSPFSNERYFFLWRPIEVSPLGIGSFFSGRGLTVLKSEICWVGIPSLVITAVPFFLRRK